VHRPTLGGGSRGYAITGHHEILLPLLAAALVEAQRTSRNRGKGKAARKR
jgi:hypothetical protein